jgi:hypothetical protein
MNNKTSQANLERENALSRLGVLGDILIVTAPIVLLGAIGNLIGLGTLAGGAVINLGYVLAILLGGLILKRRNSGWSELGLKKPASWWRTASLGVAAGIGAVVVFVLVQNLAVGLLSALGLAPSEIDQSRFNAAEVVSEQLEVISAR